MGSSRMACGRLIQMTWCCKFSKVNVKRHVMVYCAVIRVQVALTTSFVTVCILAVMVKALSSKTMVENMVSTLPTRAGCSIHVLRSLYIIFNLVTRQFLMTVTVHELRLLWLFFLMMSVFFVLLVEGMWALSMREGEGEETWRNGDKYVGQFSRDKMHGLGK